MKKYNLKKLLENSTESKDFFNDYKILLKSKKFDSDSIEQITRSISSLYSKMILKDDKTKFNCSTGIACGKIQSGKTSAFIGLISYSFDNYTNISIVIGGKDSVLYKQNEDRINEAFAKNNNIKIINISAIDENRVEDIIKYLGNSKNKLIISVLKESKNLNNLKLFLTRDAIKNKKILIIDDEGDQASLNSNKFTKKTHPTVFYKTIFDVLRFLDNFSYIQVTGTPYANIFLDKLDILRPRFIEIFYPGGDYHGLETFHGDNENQYVKIITDKIIEEVEVPNSFTDALSHFVVASVLISLDNNDANTMMLFHKERKVIYQTSAKEKIKEIIDKMISYSKSNDKYQGFIEFITKGKDEYMKNEYDEKSAEFKAFLNKCVEVLENIEVIEINKTNKERKNKSANQLGFSKNIIIVGADLVERGVTFDKLIIAYMIRRSKSKANADRMLQRARWFGYRKNNLEYMKIFCTKQIKEDYEDIYILEEDL